MHACILNRLEQTVYVPLVVCQRRSFDKEQYTPCVCVCTFDSLFVAVVISGAAAAAAAFFTLPHVLYYYDAFTHMIVCSTLSLCEQTHTVCVCVCMLAGCRWIVLYIILILRYKLFIPCIYSKRYIYAYIMHALTHSLCHSYVPCCVCRVFHNEKKDQKTRGIKILACIEPSIWDCLVVNERKKRGVRTGAYR